ncbi:MAG: NRAMP family divalent metal transporter [Longimicrobiaceae bacterium]
MSRLASVLFWSVIAAAFIGPGTVTTAAAAGAAHGTALLWALAFSTVATVVLQEAAARLTVVSGKDLGQAIRDRSAGTPAGPLVLLLVLGAIVLGNAAYEAGNILGGGAGVLLGLDLPGWGVTLAIGALAAGLLWTGTPKRVALLLALTVAVMGVAFLAAAFLLSPDPAALAVGALVPRLPAGAELLVLGLVGTTVVPYNLFLGSGIAAGQSVGELRFGISLSVILGGAISMAVLVVGTAVAGEFSFELLAAALEETIGGGSTWLLALGLFAAGFSSAVTAPLAAAVTARSLFGDQAGRWDARGWRYRSVWCGVLGAGLAFGLSGVRPIPVIILAQALNGVLLPFAAVFLLLAVNDRGLMGEQRLNGWLANSLSGVVVGVAVVLGSASVVRAGFAALGARPPDGWLVLALSLAVAAVIALPVGRAVARGRRGARPLARSGAQDTL